MNNKVPVFGKRQAGVYRLSEIYNPDDVNSSVQNLNKVIPAIGSLVVDDTVGNHNTLYVVYSVDAVTHRSSLVPASMTNLTDGANQTITFGNDVYMLFFDPTAKDFYYVTTDTTRQAGAVYYTKVNDNYIEYTGDTLETGVTYYKKRALYEISVDSRISVYGMTAVTYTLFRTSSLNSVSTATEVISQFFTDPNTGETYENYNIPMETIRIPESDNSGNYITCQAKRPITCYSATEPSDGDKYLLVAYDMTGRTVAQVVLNGHQMTGLEILNSSRHTVVNFTVTANQYDPLDGKIYLVQGQDPNDLIFYPEITYDDNTTVSLAIDGVNTFVYHDDMSNAIAGSDYTLVFKHYLSPTELVSVSGDYHLGETGRFISIEKSLKVVASAASSVGKIMPILCFAGNSNGYKILPLVYYSNLTAPTLSRVDGAVSGFNGITYTGSEQSVTLKYYNSELQQDVKQSYRIALTPSSTTDGVWYYYRDTNDANRVYYGKNPRPLLTRIHFLPTSDTSYQAGKTYYEYNASTGMYTQFSGSAFVPGVTYYEDKSHQFFYRLFTSSDSTYTNEAEWFLRYYYYATNPPTPYGATSMIRPTHFSIRKVDLTAWDDGDDDAEVIPVAVSPTNIDTFFAKPINERYIILTSALENSSGNRPSTAIVEFLYSEGSGTSSMKYICGVPVDVVAEP